MAPIKAAGVVPIKFKLVPIKFGVVPVRIKNEIDFEIKKREFGIKY